MIMAGVKLMFVGMGTVVLFLCLMIFLLKLVSHLTKDYTARELADIEAERKRIAEAAKAKKLREKNARQQVHSDGDADDIAVIAAAIAAFEADRIRTC